MLHLYQVLRQKEMDLERVRNEVQALKFVIPLLQEEAESTESASPVSDSQNRHSGGRGIKSSAAKRDFSI